MKYIDKHNEGKKAKAHATLDDFLRRFHQGGAIPFPDDLYGALGDDRNNGTKTRQQYCEDLLEENDCRCCYCMRTISRNEKTGLYPATLEHVIPQSVKTLSEYEQYFAMLSDLERRDMTLTASFVKTPKWPPYPHHIAYENLVPSCNGQLVTTTSQTCNNKRGNKFVPPFIFRKTIHDEVKYYDDGTVVWTEDPGDEQDCIPYLNILGLNCLELRAIRCIWYFLSLENRSYDISNREYILNVIRAELDDDTPESRELLEKLSAFDKDNNGKDKDDKNDKDDEDDKKDYWSLLKEFEYFKDITLFSHRQKPK